jgi:hypothetical protein
VGVAIGEAAGPLLGGPVYDKLGHWAVFGIVQALLAADIAFRLLVRDNKPDREGKASDYQGSEADALLKDGQLKSSGNDTICRRDDLEGGSNDAGCITSGAGVMDSSETAGTIILKSLAWNWLGSTVGLVVVFVVRVALELVSRSARIQPLNLVLT